MLHTKNQFLVDSKKGSFLHIYLTKCNYIIYYSFFPCFTSHFWKTDSTQDMEYLWFNALWQNLCSQAYNSLKDLYLFLIVPYYWLKLNPPYNLIHHITLKSHFKVAEIRSEWQEKWSLHSVCKTHVITYRKNLVRTNLRIREHLLHIVDWAIWNPTTFKELQPFHRCFFWKPKSK